MLVYDYKHTCHVVVYAYRDTGRWAIIHGLAVSHLISQGINELLPFLGQLYAF